MKSTKSFITGDQTELLFCLDLANNHQGSVSHGKNILSEVAGVAQRTNAHIIAKLQFRDLDTFLHPADREMIDADGETLSRHTKRFMDTRMILEQFGELVDHAKGLDLPIYATPFDEASVDTCVDFGFDVIKVASCSAYDWPLLRKIGSTDLPVIISVGGLRLNEIDSVVDYFDAAGNPFALMHCVSVYPTPMEDLQMDFVRQMRERYPHLVIGYSGHEGRKDVDVSGLAVAKGARIIERHVGVPTDKIKLNKYSLAPPEAEKWVQSAQRAAIVCANGQTRRPVKGEDAALQSLKRGIYAKHTIPAGKTITADDVYLAMPCLEGQFHSGKYYEVVDSFTPMQPIHANMPIGVDLPEKLPKPLVLASIAARVKEMLDEAKISIDSTVEVELSHQYGFDRFFEMGAVIIDVVNRDYCKKLILQFPNQDHPSHKHIKKEETFQVLSGTVDLLFNGSRARLVAGEKQVVERGTFHSFSTESGVILEEVSTTHIKGDSVYADKSVPSDPTTRKTKLRLTP